MSDIRLDGSATRDGSKFDVRELLDRNWLAAAMQDWIAQSPVRVCISREQAQRLQGDWYYRHAQFDPIDEGRVLMTFGQDMPEIVFELLRWLGPGAELIEPREWRAAFRAELERMIAIYERRDPPTL
jgi:predicted DNA-binding transcriptional regulator YafY